MLFCLDNTITKAPVEKKAYRAKITRKPEVSQQQASVFFCFQVLWFNCFLDDVNFPQAPLACIGKQWTSGDMWQKLLIEYHWNNSKVDQKRTLEMCFHFESDIYVNIDVA